MLSILENPRFACLHCALMAAAAFAGTAAMSQRSAKSDTARCDSVPCLILDRHGCLAVDVARVLRA